MAKRKPTFKERLNLELMLRIGAGGIHAAADIQEILDADRRKDPTTRQPASERVRLALAKLYPAAPPDPKWVPTNVLVEQVQGWLKKSGLPPVSAPTVKRVSGRWSKREYGEQHQAAARPPPTLLDQAKALLAGNSPPLLVEIARPQARPKYDIARRALAELYPQGAPATVPNKRVVNSVAEWLKAKGLSQIGQDTILKAAGRR